MGVEIISNHRADVFICNTSDVAFGPVMTPGTAEDFQEWLQVDPRRYDTDELCHKYNEFLEVLEEFMICAECGYKHVGGTAGHDKAMGLA